MGRENKKEAVALLHRTTILQAAEALFAEKGYERTGIDDISARAAYSRRTIYAYFESKQDILHHIIEKGLLCLRDDIEAALAQHSGFRDRYKAICDAMVKYHRECPFSMESVNRARADELDAPHPSAAVRRILALGTAVNGLLVRFVRDGQAEGTVRQDILPEMTVYVLWSGISALLQLFRTKGGYIAGQLSLPEEACLACGFGQMVDGITEGSSKHEAE